MVIDSKKNPGSRIQEITVHGNTIDNDRYYSVASTTFIRNGGDGYTSLTKGEAIENTDNGMLLSMLFKEYLEKNKVISTTVENRILIL
jgi:5'-nucleotidase/UDP-sugar diphosphatase